ncbi:MAG: cobyrinate a,c-diamide synthase [Faecalibacterium sp.]
MPKNAAQTQSTPVQGAAGSTTIQSCAPRVLIAGSNSGCGKTTITCALLSALMQSGVQPASFKCGPDYIDPMFHSKIIGVPSYNLDPYFYQENTLKYLLAQHAGEISVMEGVMGLFDGMQMHSTDCSTYSVAKTTKTPVILTLNAKGMAYSILPMIEGFARHKSDYTLAGVILNQVTKGSYALLKPMIEQHFQGKIKVFGYLPRLPEELQFASRHLGLVTAGEVCDIQKKMAQLGEIARETLAVEEILAVANAAPALAYQPLAIHAVGDAKPVRIAVAQDNAFCFYYQDNLQLLQQLGAEIVPFSPLRDAALPSGVDGLYLGGGYPELYLPQLAQNEGMKASIHAFLTAQKPCVAECGGFMYLTQSIDDLPMVGFLPGQCHNTGKLSRFGYANFTAMQDSLLCAKGESFRGHEFHYYDCTHNGDAYLAQKQSGKQWQGVQAGDVIHAGFAHIPFYAAPILAVRFLEKCRE